MADSKITELLAAGFESTGLAVFDIVQAAQASTEFPIVTVTRVDEGALVVEAIADLTQSGLRPGNRFELTSRFEADVVGLRSPVVVTDAPDDKHFAERAERSGIGAYLGVPITLEGGTLYGVLSGYDASPRPIRKSEVQLFKALARAIAREMERSAGLESLPRSTAEPWKKLSGMAAAIADTWEDLTLEQRQRVSDAVARLFGDFSDAIGGEEPLEPEEAEPPNQCPAEIDSVVLRAAKLLPNLPGPRVRVNASSNVLVDMESRLVERILANLLLNAWRTSPPDTKMTVTSARHGGWVELAVEDQSGLTPDDRPRRLHPAGGRIGIPLVKSLVEDAGGNVREVETESGRRWVVRLPVLRGSDESEPIATVTPIR